MHLSKMVMANLNHFCVFIILFSWLAKLIWLLKMLLIHFKIKNLKKHFLITMYSTDQVFHILKGERQKNGNKMSSLWDNNHVNPLVYL